MRISVSKAVEPLVFVKDVVIGDLVLQEGFPISTRWIRDP